MDTIKTFNTEIARRMADVEKDVPTFASAYQLRDLQKIVVKLPTNEEMAKMRERLAKTIEDFTRDNNEFRRGHEEHIKIIARFDEVIAQKVNKHTLTEEIQKINKKYKPKLKEIDAKHEK